MEFYKCEHCGNVAVKLVDAGVPLVCCGQKMTKLVPGAGGGDERKHVPTWFSDEGTISVHVGMTAHPSEEGHYIAFIALQTLNGFQIVQLEPGDVPEAEFPFTEGDEVLAVYAYCNLHGLWKS